MIRYGECETCAQSDKRYCIGCQPLRRTDGTYSRTGWIAKPGITMTVTSLAYPAAAEREGEGNDKRRARETLAEIKKAAETGLSCISCGNDGVVQLWQIVGLCDAAAKELEEAQGGDK